MLYYEESINTFHVNILLYAKYEIAQMFFTCKCTQLKEHQTDIIDLKYQK